MHEHILISTDGSEVAQKGVEHGCSLAKALNARVTLVTVTERLPAYPDGLGMVYTMSPSMLAEYTAGQDEAANRVLAKAKETAGRLGVTAETLHIPNTLPAEAILATAKERGCSLIVMASHGRRGLGRLVLGSVTAEVLAHSPIPVLVVR